VPHDQVSGVLDVSVEHDEVSEAGAVAIDDGLGLGVQAAERANRDDADDD
jgi:hypothetical protein